MLACDSTRRRPRKIEAGKSHENYIKVANGHLSHCHYTYYFDEDNNGNWQQKLHRSSSIMSGIGMFVDLLERTLELPLQSEIITQPYVDFLAHQYELSHNGAFGLEHWLRTLINGRILAEKTGADIAVVEHFSMLHDIKRQDEYHDIEHGARAAEFAKSIQGDWIHLDHSQLLKLDEAIRFHSMGRLSRDITVQVCWDSNRLDLGRLGNKPDPSYLGTRIARDPTFIKEAMHRSKRRFVNYDFRG